MNSMRMKIFSSVLLVVLALSFVGGVMAQTNASIIINDIKAQPLKDKYGYGVDVYLSAFQAGGDVIKDLNINSLSLTEDGKPVNLIGLEPADDPINVVLVMDTSGSMHGTKLDAAKNAASQFLSRLGSKDLAAVVSFNSKVQTNLGFTDDLSDAKEKMDLLTSVEGSGTCLYDAINEAITITATIPAGRRSIVLLTDGVDELPPPKNGQCSKKSLDEVINFAKAENTRVPIYTIGLGTKVGSEGLQRIANETGGRYSFADDAGKLDGLFTKLTDSLRLQYIAKYESLGTPGPHTLVVDYKISEMSVRQLSEFVLPNFPFSLVILSPQEGDKITGKTRISVQPIGPGDPISKIEFFVNDASIGIADTLPYEIEWEPSQDMNGDIKIEAVAMGENDKALIKASIAVVLNISAPVKSGATSTPKATQTPVSEVPPKDSGKGLNIFVIVGVVVTVIVLVVVIIIIAVRRNKSNKKTSQSSAQPNTGWSSKDSPSTMEQDRTLDGFGPSTSAMGVLSVLESDDRMMVGQILEITKQSTTLGRKADNDIILPKDNPVSRHHAIIEERNGALYISEILSTDEGSPKRPAYGTFVNENQIQDQVRLNSGDIIRLGKRVRMRFESVTGGSDDERTLDQLEGIDNEKTQDI